MYRDSTLLAALPGSESQYTDHANRGLYRYEVSGVRGATETARASGFEFAGLVTCHAEDGFESGSGVYWETDGSSWDVTPLANSGTWGFTDSPAGTYLGCPNGTAGCKVNAIAQFGVPTRLPAGSSLEFDQICATEDNFDYSIVEVSTDHGGSWTEIARYDQGDDAGWGDGVGDPTDYRHASLDLSAFANQLVVVRFRLESDQLLQFDGWYIDNVQINDANCTPVVSVMPAQGLALRMLPPSPNPSPGATYFAFTLPQREDRVELALYDPQGRAIRRASLGPLGPGNHSWVWDGRDRNGHAASSGVYFAQLRVAGAQLTQKVLKLAR